MLRREGIRVGGKRVGRLIRLEGLQGAHRRRRKGCTIRVPGVEPFADLVGRDFLPEAPNPVWAADIEQIRTGEGRLHLVAVQETLVSYCASFGRLLGFAARLRGVLDAVAALLLDV